MVSTKPAENKPASPQVKKVLTADDMPPIMPQTQFKITEPEEEETPSPFTFIDTE